MLTNRVLLEGITHGDWLTSIDLNDVYFHIGVYPQHRKFLRFFFKGTAYQYKVLPFLVFPGPQNFHFGAPSGPGTAITHWHYRPLLHRDLLIQSRSRAQAMPDTQAVILLVQPGVLHQCGEVLLHALPDDSLLGHSVGFGGDGGAPLGSQGGGHPLSGAQGLHLPQSLGRICPETTGSHGSS